MANFIISVDTCVDLPKSYLEKYNVHYIIMSVIENEEKMEEYKFIFDTPQEFDLFYDKLKSGAKFSTIHLRSNELHSYFAKLLNKELDVDIIHVSLSGNLSSTCSKAIDVAKYINVELEAIGEKRRVYVIDSFNASCGMAQLVNKLIELRNEGVATLDAVKQIKRLRNHQQGWTVLSDLSNAKRRRIPKKAKEVGTDLNARPILYTANKGILTLENNMYGDADAILYILSRMKKNGEEAVSGFANTTVWVYRTSKSELAQKMRAAIVSAYPNIKIKDGIVGPVVGTHLRHGAVIVLWEGAPRDPPDPEFAMKHKESPPANIYDFA